MDRFPGGVRLALLLLVAAAPAAAQAPGDAPAAPEVLGAPAAFGPEAAPEARVAVAEGSPLRELPDARSASLTTVDAASELPVVERHGAWARVRYGALVGWVLVEGAAPAAEDAPAIAPAVLSSAGAARRAETLAAVEARLGPPPADRPRLGDWTLYTDVADPDLLAFLDRVAARLPELYRERYGLDPGAASGEAILLFADGAAYRAFSEEHTGLLGIGEGGHAGQGVAALYAGERDRREVAALLVHELAHLLNARTLGSRTPPWLEEGLANDLAFSEIGHGGRLAPGTVGGTERRDASLDPSRKLVVRTSWEGGKGAVVALGRRLQGEGLPRLELLAQMPWYELVDPVHRTVLYAQSAFFVRYLLEREPEALARFLRHLAAGGAGEAAVLVEALGGDRDTLDGDFQAWLLARADDLGLLPDP